MSNDDGGEKSHAPSQRKLDEARNRGEIPASPDLYAAASLGGLLVAALIFGPTVVRQAGTAATVALEQADRLAPMILRAPDGPLTGWLGAMLVPLAPLLVLPLVAVLLAGVSQQSLRFSAQRIAPKLSHISPLANAGHKFGPEGLVNFAKSSVKLFSISIILVLFLRANSQSILSSLYFSPGQGAAEMAKLLLRFLMLALLLTAIIGAVDYGWQFFRHLSRNRMTRQEVVDEHKDAEGDPHLKGRRRQRGQEIAMNRMILAVEKADVVIVNPTHFAVALRWKRGDKTAPICLAKGVDEVAARIREKAAVHGIPIHADPPTARAIHATVDVGQPIRPEQFRAVAAAIRFAEAMRKRAKSRIV